MVKPCQVAGNQLTLLQNGAEYFPLLCADIDAAQHTILLETYIFAADQTGQTISAALQRAARRGVSVRVTGRFRFVTTAAVMDGSDA